MRQTQLIMGMPITVELVDGLPDSAHILQAVFENFRDIDEVFSPYKPTSLISRLNQKTIGLEDCPETVRVVFRQCEAINEQTEGYFNITNRGVIDPSGYVKGWSIQAAADILGNAGATNFMVSAGGDVATAGYNNQGQPWKVGIKHPTKRHQYAKVLSLSGQAIATSGIYERGHHIYDPHTGEMVQGLLSLSVVGPNIIDADIMATAAFAMGAERGLQFIVKAGLEGYAIIDGFNTILTPGFNQFIDQD